MASHYEYTSLPKMLSTALFKHYQSFHNYDGEVEKSLLSQMTSLTTSPFCAFTSQSILMSVLGRAADREKEGGREGGRKGGREGGEDEGLDVCIILQILLLLLVQS